MVSRSLKAHILLIFVTFVWGSTFVVVKNALADSSPLLLNAVRTVLAAVALGVIFRKELPKITRGALWAGFEIGTCLWLGYEFQTVGLKYTSASKSAFLTGISMVLVPVLLAVFWRRRINRWTLGGVVAAFIGLYLLTVPAGQGGLDFASEALTSMNRGDLLTLVCALAFAVQIVFVGRSALRFPFAQIVVIEIAVCAAWMVVSVPLAEHDAFIRWTPPVIEMLVICGLLGTVLAFAVQAWAQQFTPPTHTALIFSLEPVFAGVTSYFVLGERLGWRGGLGAGMILAGVLASEFFGSVVQEAEEELQEEVR